MWIIRKLNPDDAEAWASVRLEALNAHPLAFSSSVPENTATMLESIRPRLAPGNESAVFGAFTGESLIGIAGIVRNAGLKERHKSLIWGMYVAAESRRVGVGER